jgi:hypothetical protein
MAGRACKLRSKLKMKRSQPFMSNVSAIDTRAQPESTEGVTADLPSKALTSPQQDEKDLPEKEEKVEPGSQVERSVDASRSGTERSPKPEPSKESALVEQDGGEDATQLENSAKEAGEREKRTMRNALLRVKKQKAKRSSASRSNRAAALIASR